MSTLHLGSRQATHDVDFFGTNLDNDQRWTLSDAMKYAQRISSRPLGEEWLNNEMMQWLSPPIHTRLTQEALQQDSVVFQEQGLKVVAAPFSYMFAAKVNRIGSDTRRGYDLSDAVAYLHEFILRKNNGQPVSVRTVEGWFAGSGLQSHRSVLKSGNQAYRQKYG